jgi:iron complex outermembrane recepter protein
MRHNLAYCVSALALFTGAGITSAARAQEQTDTKAPAIGSEDNASTLETGVGDIIVTATRRETSLQRIPQSIAVIGGDLQRDRGQQRLEDLQLSVPNISFASTSNNSQLYVRGVGNTFINAGGDPGVAFYQDGAYVSDQRTVNTSLFDIERVEILRGPQGALYGRNAVGGAVNVISAKPTGTFKGRIDALAGDYGRYESEGFVSGPFGDSGVSGRISYQIRRFDGYTKNLLANLAGAPDRFDDLKSEAVRGQLAFDLGDDGGKITLLVSHYNEDDAGPAIAVVSTPGFVYPAEALFGLRPTNDPRRVNATVGALDLKVTTANATIVQPIGAVTMTVIGNYRKGEQNFLNDCDGTAAEACRYSTNTFSRDYYTEGYLTSPSDGAFRWTVGGTYSRLRQRQRITVPWQSLLAYIVPTAATNIPFPISYDAGAVLDVESYAAYLDARLQLSPVWAISGQVRHSKTTKKADEFQTIPEFGVNVPSFKSTLKNEHTPFKIGVEGQLTPDILIYASYATANKDGAINVGALQTRPVLSESVKSFEIGAKTSFLDRRLQMNGAIFTSNYKNLQIAQVIQTVAALANVPKSKISGAELEIVALPVTGLRFAASLGYLDAKFEQFSNSPTIPGLAPGPAQDLSGNRLPNVPKTSVTLDGQYKFAPADGFEMKFGAQVNFRSRVYFNEFNDDNNSQGSTAIVNLNASVGPAKESWQIYGYVRNLTNKTYISGSTIYSGLLGAEKAFSYAAPRTFAVGLRYSF